MLNSTKLLHLLNILSVVETVIPKIYFHPTSGIEHSYSLTSSTAGLSASENTARPVCFVAAVFKDR